ncbi:MAG: C39 family peptidase, partial [Planctomycetota bacterium]
VHALRVHDEVGEFRSGRAAGGSVEERPPAVVLRPAAGEGTAWYESGAIEAPFPFREALISWNADVPEGAGISVELRVGRASGGSWSPYLYAGDWGEVPEGIERRERADEGRIDVDYFRSEAEYDLLQYRIRAHRKPEARVAVRIRRVAVVLTGGTAAASPGAALEPEEGDPPGAAWKRVLDVPARSQKVEAPEIARRICSPTCVAMALEYRGVRRPTREVAERAYDPRHGIYGNWPRAIQAAYTYGVPGYLARFSTLREARREIGRGQPLVISIRAAKGELRGAPYEATDGHLLVLVGFDEAGDVVVNDPAAPAAEGCRRTYAASEIEKVWLGRGGTAYVFLPRG